MFRDVSFEQLFADVLRMKRNVAGGDRTMRDGRTGARDQEFSRVKVLWVMGI